MSSVRSLTQERLKELLSYDPYTGLFTRIVAPQGTNAGDTAGCLNRRGYVLIGVDYISHRAQRLAWLYMTGEHPTGEVDHINGVRNDNRWSNLRDVSSLQNKQNQRRAHRNNISGLLGVCTDHNGKWRARIRVNGKRLNLGCFNTPEEAHTAYMAAKTVHHI